MRTLSLNKPHLLVMVGIPGSGKSFFADQFAETFNIPLVSFDRIRRELFTEPGYTIEEQSRIAKVASYMTGELFKTNGSIIFDGSGSLRSDREILAKVARKAGYEALFIWVQTEPSSAQQRAVKRKDAVPLTTEQFNAFVRRFSPPHPSETSIVISGKHTYASQLKHVLKRLVEPRAEAPIQPQVAKRPLPSGGRNIVVR